MTSTQEAKSVPPIKVAAFSGYLQVEDAQLLDMKSCHAIRFTVSFFMDDDTKVLSIPGWRVKSGVILVPTRRSGKFEIPVCKVEHGGLGRLLRKAVQDWREEFPQVDFPDAPQEPKE